MSESTGNKNNNPMPPFSNKQWVELLSEPPNEQAVNELRRFLIRGLKPSLAKYVDRELDQFVEDVAQDSLITILDNIETFRGESKFTTWAMKIAVREGLSELRRKRWENISIEDMKGSEGEDEQNEVFSNSFANEEVTPEETTAQKMVLEKVQKMVQELLTERQKKALQSLVINNIPISVVAEQMNTNRNNLYKLVYDARQKLKKELEVQGINPDDMLNRLSST